MVVTGGQRSRGAARDGVLHRARRVHDGHDGQRRSPAPGTAAPPFGEDDAAPSLCPSCSSTELVAYGGETQEFDGGRPALAIVSKTPRPLSDPELAPLLARVEGTHDLTFRWREPFSDGGIEGHDEVTRVALDVRALRAFDVQLQSEEHPSTVHLELAVELGTADRALRGSVVHTVDASSLSVPAGSDHVITELAVPYPLQDFRGSLDLGLDPAREVVASLELELLFSGQGVRGRLAMFVEYPPGGSRLVLAGAFPDDGCAFQEWPVPLDATVSALGERTLREHFDALAAALSEGPLPSAGDTTRPDLTLELGPADHGCQYWPTIATVRAPLRLRSGSIALEQAGTVQFSRPAGASLRAELQARSPFMLGERLFASTGIEPGDIAGDANVAPVVHTLAAADGLWGSLSLDILDGHERRGRSLLDWCSGSACE